MSATVYSRYIECPTTRHGEIWIYGCIFCTLNVRTQNWITKMMVEVPYPYSMCDVTVWAFSSAEAPEHRGACTQRSSSAADPGRSMTWRPSHSQSQRPAGYQSKLKEKGGRAGRAGPLWQKRACKPRSCFDRPHGDTLNAQKPQHHHHHNIHNNPNLHYAALASSPALINHPTGPYLLAYLLLACPLHTPQ